MWVTSGHLSRDRAFVYWFFLLSARPRNFDRRTEQHDEANHGVDVAKTVGDPEQQLDLVVRRLDSGIAQSVAHRIEDVFPVPSDLASELDERRDTASLRPTEPPVQLLFSERRVRQLEDEAKLLLHRVASHELGILGLDERQPFLLLRREILGILAERVFRLLDLLDILLRLPDPFLCIPVVRRSALLALAHHLRESRAGTAPGVDAHRIERLVRPFDDVERIDAAPGVRAEVLRRVGNPPRAVAGDEEDRRALLFRQLAEEHLDDLLAVALVRPYDGVRVVVDDNRDVAVPLAITGLVDADPHEAVESFLHVGFELVPDEVDEMSDRLPVDPQVLGDLLLAEPALDHPGRREREVRREARSRLGPWNGCGHHPVLRTGYARDLGADPHGDGAEVHAAPERLAAGIVVYMAFLSADRASPPEPLADVDVHDERGLAFRVFPEIEAVDNRPLDMEEMFQWTIGRHPMSFRDNGGFEKHHY